MNMLCNRFTAGAGYAVDALAIVCAKPTGLRWIHTMNMICNRFTAGAGCTVVH